MAARDQYPSYETLNQTNSVTGSLAFCRLRWFLKGNIGESIRVLEDPTNPDSTQESYQTANSLHPVSAESITHPPVSSIQVSVDELNEWEYRWEDEHDGDEDEDEDDGLGERPPPGPTLSITAEPGQFVTIEKFIELVHPWLIGLRGDIRASMAISGLGTIPESADIALLCASPNPILLTQNHTNSQELFNDALSGASRWASTLQERQNRSTA